MECLALLRDAKVNLEAKTYDGATPAHYAAHKGHVECLALLRDAKVNLEAKEIKGTTPLYLAIAAGHTAAVAFLEDHISHPKPAAAITVTKIKKDTTIAPRECANCAISDIILQSCSRCKLVAYCGKACQTQHWKQGGHKHFCVPLDLRVPPPKEPRKAQSTEDADKVVCSICLDPMVTGGTHCILACGHEFHAVCVAGLRTFWNDKVCPICREKA